MTENKSEFPRNKQSASGTESAFSVEARFVGGGARQFGKQLFSREWTRVHFDEGLVGVPVQRSRYDVAAPYFRLVPYQAAQALRWWFHAALENEHSDTCFETRLVEHRVRYSLEAEAVAVHQMLGCSDGLDRSLHTSQPPREGKDGQS